MSKRSPFLSKTKSSPEFYKLAKSVGLSEEFNVPNDFRRMIRQKSAAKGIVRADELEFLETAGNFCRRNAIFTKLSDKLEKFISNNGKKIVRQELHYYVPCVIRGRMIAVIGLGRASDGSLLSSEDLENFADGFRLCRRRRRKFAALSGTGKTRRRTRFAQGI